MANPNKAAKERIAVEGSRPGLYPTSRLATVERRVTTRDGQLATVRLPYDAEGRLMVRARVKLTEGRGVW